MYWCSLLHKLVATQCQVELQVASQPAARAENRTPAALRHCDSITVTVRAGSLPDMPKAPQLQVICLDSSDGISSHEASLAGAASRHHADVAHYPTITRSTTLTSARCS